MISEVRDKWKALDRQIKQMKVQTVNEYDTADLTLQGILLVNFQYDPEQVSKWNEIHSLHSEQRMQRIVPEMN